MRFIYVLVTLLVITLVQNTMPVNAMVKMNGTGINKAIKYGMQRGRSGIIEVLGPNWVEKPDGTLLNVYTPFMLLAARVSRGGYPANPTPEEIKKARGRYARIIRTLRDERDPQGVKFVVAMFGPDDKFQRDMTARVEGIGRGHKFRLQPTKRIIDRFADPIAGGSGDVTEYQASNAYYFSVERLGNMDELDLILEKKDDPAFQPIVFHLDMKRLL